MTKNNVTEEIVKDCIDGNDVAWAILVDMYIGVVYKAIVLVLNKYLDHTDEHDVNDICQNTFLKLFINNCSVLKSYDQNKSKFSTWITVVSRNLAIDYIRKIKEKNTPISDIVDSLHMGGVTGREKISVPEDVISPRQHLVLRMIYDDGLDVEETARFLSVKRQTIRSLHHRAIKKLREHYGLGAGQEKSSCPADTTQS